MSDSPRLLGLGLLRSPTGVNPPRHRFVPGLADALMQAFASKLAPTGLVCCRRFRIVLKSVSATRRASRY